jgi:hypothetical protein
VDVLAGFLLRRPTGWGSCRCSRRCSSRCFRGLAGLEQAIERQVGQRVGFNELADLFDGVVGGDEFALAGRVDAVEAGRNGRRATDAEMDFCCAGAADHADDFAAGGAADDGVVDEDDALAFEQVVNGVELEADAEVADALLGLNEGAAHVVVADEAERKGGPLSSA